MVASDLTDQNSDTSSSKVLGVRGSYIPGDILCSPQAALCIFFGIYAKCWRRECLGKSHSYTVFWYYLTFRQTFKFRVHIYFDYKLNIKEKLILENYNDVFNEVHVCK